MGVSQIMNTFFVYLTFNDLPNVKNNLILILKMSVMFCNCRYFNITIVIISSIVISNNLIEFGNN